MRATGMERPMWVLLAMVLLVGTIALFGNVLLLLFAGILLAVLLRAGASKLATWCGMPVGAGLALLLILVLLGFALFGMVVAPQVKVEGAQLLGQLPSAWARLQALVGPLAGDWLPQTQPDPSMLQPVLMRSLGVLSNTVGALGSAAVVLVTGIYLAADPDSYRRGLLILLPKARRARVSEVLDELHRTLLNWLKGVMMGMAAIGTLTGIGLLFLGVPLALTLALIAGLLNFIPNVGPILSSMPAILLASGGGLESVAWVVGLYLVVQALESYVITPKIQEHSIALPPVLTMSAQLLLGLGAGILGLTLATPLAAVLVVLVREFYVKDTLGDRDVETAQNRRKPTKA